MLIQPTLDSLNRLKLYGMAAALSEQLTQSTAHSLAFEERFGLLVDRETAWRDTRRLERLLKQARLKFPGACLEDLDTRAPSASRAAWTRAGPIGTMAVTTLPDTPSGAGPR